VKRYSRQFSTICVELPNTGWAAGVGAKRGVDSREIAKSDLVVVWGGNPAVTNPHRMRFLEEAKGRGTRLVCIDPIRTKTAALCDEHLAPRPGTDGFLANAVARVLIEEGLHDEAFVRDHVHGFDEYRDLIRQYEPAKAERVCGIPAKRVVEFARAFAAKQLAMYGRLPAYRAMLEREGVDGPEHLLAVGGEDAVLERLAAFAKAGATDLRVGALCPVSEETERTRELLGALSRKGGLS